MNKGKVKVLDFESEKVQKVIEIQSRIFSSNYITMNSDDLRSEAYFVWLRCKNRFNFDLGNNFVSLYKRSLANHYKDMYRKESLRFTVVQTVDITDDDLVEDLGFVTEWTPEDEVTYISLVASLLASLSLTAQVQVRVMMEHPERLRKVANRSGVISNMALCRALGISQKEVAQNRQCIKDSTLRLVTTD